MARPSGSRTVAPVSGLPARVITSDGTIDPALLMQWLRALPEAPQPPLDAGSVIALVGPVEETASVAWLRPETAQGIFVNFDNVQQSARRKLPFGIAQIGKSFRNEITPGNFIFRSREFEQMEMQYFVRPEDAPRIYDEWKETRRQWYRDLARYASHADLASQAP